MALQVASQSVRTTKVDSGNNQCERASKMKDDCDESLCCCEYINADGKRAHLLSLCCDCAELDDAVDRLVCGRTIPTGRCNEILEVVEDRCRIPFKGGAIKFPPEALVPLVIVPLAMSLAQLSTAALVIVHLLLPIIAFACHRFIKRVRPQSKLFAVWSTVEFLYLFYIYEFRLVGVLVLPRYVSPWENLLLVVLLVGAVLCLYLIHKDRQVEYADGSGSVFCRACHRHVRNRDHHCVWIDACVSRSNERAFVGFLALTWTLLLHCGLLLLTSVCRSHLLDLGFLPQLLVPKDCSVLNDKLAEDAALIYVGGVHALVIAVPIFFLLSQRVIYAGRKLFR